MSTIAVKVFCCDNMAFYGDYQPMLAKHSKHFNLHNALAVGIDQMQHNFKPMAAQVEAWRAAQIEDDDARSIIYRAFIEDQLDAPKHLAKVVHANYFNVLARFLEVGESRTEHIDSSLDREWHTTVRLRLGPHPKMKEAQRRAIERDFGMVNGEASVVSRVCLSYYVERQLGLDLDPKQIMTAQRWDRQSSTRTAVRRFCRPITLYKLQSGARASCSAGAPWSPTNLPQAIWSGRSNSACLPASPITWSIPNVLCSGPA
jgi:hypothetical protein